MVVVVFVLERLSEARCGSALWWPCALAVILSPLRRSDSIDNMGLDEILAMPWLDGDAAGVGVVGGLGGMLGEGGSMGGGGGLGGVVNLQGMQGMQGVVGGGLDREREGERERLYESGHTAHGHEWSS